MNARKFKSGGVSQCFECQKQLVRIKGGFLFSEVADPLGNVSRVHKQCLKLAIGHGYRAKAEGKAS